MKKVYIVGIGGIGISGIARYYNENGYKVYGSDAFGSELIDNMIGEGMDIIVGEDSERIDESFEKIIYTEAVPLSQKELSKAKSLSIKIQTYPESLAEIANEKKLIAISGTHGKSTTTSIISIMMKDSKTGLNALVGTILKEFNGKNVYFSESDYFALEACEYKRSFLKYKPFITVITNIDLDHLDYFKDLEDYKSAYSDLIENMQKGGYVIFDKNDQNSLSIANKRGDINYIGIDKNGFIFNGEEYKFPEIEMKIPGEHILFDAKLAYTCGIILGLENSFIKGKIEEYNGVWRRMETVKEFENGNILMSDYGHHPSEIKPTLKALKEANNDRDLVVFFQPHQYSRTLELLDEFEFCFEDADRLVIPDIYESRDTEEIKAKINHKMLLEKVKNVEKIDGNGLKNTEKLLKNELKTNKNAIILLLGAGNIDNLRYKI